MSDENIFVVYFGDDDGILQTTFPTETPEEREADFRECPLPTQQLDENGEEIAYSSNAEQGSSELWGVAPVDFSYSVQLNSTDTTADDDGSEPIILSKEGEKMLQMSLSNAIINSIYENECPDVSGDDAENEDKNSNSEINVRHLRRDSDSQQQQNRRRLNIQSISPGNGRGHPLRGECNVGPAEDEDVMMEDSNSTILDDTSNNSTDTAGNMTVTVPSCQEVDGTVLIGFDTLGDVASFQSVGAVVLSRIQIDMSNGVYLDQINAEMEPFNVQVTNMEYIDSDYFGQLDQGVFAPLNSLDWAQPQSSMSTFTKVTIPIIVLLFLLMICFCWCSYSSYAKMLRKRFAVFVHNDGITDDGEFTEDHEHFEPYRKPKVVETLKQVEAQPNNLSRRSSYMDVPHCNKLECRLCRHQSNFRAVSMIGELSKDLGGDEEGYCRDVQSLEATFQDVSQIKQKGYSGEEGPYPTKTFSTVPHQSRNRFSLTGKRSPSLIRIVAEDKHNQDGFYNEPEMVSFVKVNSLVDKPSNNNSQKNGQQRNLSQRQLSRARSAPNTPWGVFSNMFGGNGQGNDDDGAVTNINDLGNFACDPRGLNNVMEIDDDERSDDPLDFSSIPVPRSSTMYSYTPSQGSQVEASRTAWSLPTSWMAPFAGATDGNQTGNNTDSYHSRGDTTKSFSSGTDSDPSMLRRQFSMEDSIVFQDPAWVAAYKNGGARNQGPRTSNSNNRKSKQRLNKMRRHSLDTNRNGFGNQAPIQVGKKRTWTDDRGKVRQEVSL